MFCDSLWHIGSMSNIILRDVAQAETSNSFISKLHSSISNGLPHAEPVLTFKIDERELVQGILQMLQGFSSSSFYWDEHKQEYCLKNGIYVTHLSYTSLYNTLSQFLFAGTCLKQVEIHVQKVQSTNFSVPTLKAFANSASSWLKRLRDVVLKEEVNVGGSDSGAKATLLGLTDSLSSIHAGAELLHQIVYGAIPRAYHHTSPSASELTVHILDYLFKKLNEFCLVEGGKEEAYLMLLFFFTESLLPYLEGLDSWLYDGILDDAFEEMYFYANNEVSIDQPAFWEMSYLLRWGRWRKAKSDNVPELLTEYESSTKMRNKMSEQERVLGFTSQGRDQADIDNIVCPIFLKDIAKSIVSAGKSLQLVRHVQRDHIVSLDNNNESEQYKRMLSKGFELGSQICEHQNQCSNLEECMSFYENNHARVMGFLTLPEVFLVSLVGLLVDGDHAYRCLWSADIAREYKTLILGCNLEGRSQEGLSTKFACDKVWKKFLADVVFRRILGDSDREDYNECKISFSASPFDPERSEKATKLHRNHLQDLEAASSLGKSIFYSLCPGNPVITVSREILRQNLSSWDELNISKDFYLPPINDESLREDIFGDKDLGARLDSDSLRCPRFDRTDYALGLQFDGREHIHKQDDQRSLENLYAFPTILPFFQENSDVSDLLPFQRNSTLASKILRWFQVNKTKYTLHPAVIIQECLVAYIMKQVVHVGKQMLSRLMNDWKLMNELGVLHAIYLLGSGDLLQHFLVVTFSKLDKGDICDDDFELNAILQESIRNSSDGALLSTPDSLVVSLANSDYEETEGGNLSNSRMTQNQCFGINALDMLNFSYKVSWPLDLIVNMEALKRYNQVMGFLLKVKRAKYVLDRTRKWMWKGRGATTSNYKHHLLVEQKLLHFVNAFHQYVMDQVLHTAWSELCVGMASAGSLDEVIEVHDAYLLSIQRQCFVASDKLWALIASRVKTILGLALDFHTIQQTLSSGGAASAIKARCEMEVDRIEKQFDDCVAFLLRILSFKLNVGHFPHLADLVTRINYNYFYMSDSGNLLTVPSFDASAKPGKSAMFRD
ncbi:gamma-tubulin complex component 5-like isoform X2 [Zingiber officinale]|uniref:gamma-tubulin complex component 5-like isoform X2 n=1 Tax=Zingiber officinale TaxID=94328 RepID=UPI001C4C2CC4|nr:gamma-tubulin complex component 5-like isoform X2 [Zingiber officinale]